MTLSRRVIAVTLTLFGLMAAGVFVSNGVYLRRSIEHDALFFLNDLYATLLYRSLRGSMIVGRPDQARHLYGEIREVLSEHHQTGSTSPSLRQLFDPAAASTLTVKELVVIRRNGVEAFVDNETIDFVSERTGEWFEPQEVPHEPRTFDTPAFRQARDTLQDVTRQVNTPTGRELHIYKPLPNVRRCQGCHGKDHTVRGVVHLQVPLAPMEQRIRLESTRMAVLLFAGAVFTCLVLLWFLRRWVLSPLKALTAASERIATGDLDHPPPLVGSDELAMLSQQMGQMLEGLRLRWQQHATTTENPAQWLLQAQVKDIPEATKALTTQGSTTPLVLPGQVVLAGFTNTHAAASALLAALWLHRLGATQVRVARGEDRDRLVQDIPASPGVFTDEATAGTLQAQGFLLEITASGLFHLQGTVSGSAAEQLITPPEEP